MFAVSARKFLLIGATIAALALPGVVSAETNKKTDDSFSWPQVTQVEDGEVVKVGNPVVLTGQSYDECLFLELNIPGYSCSQSLAEWAAVDDMDTFPAPPPGVDYLFWEMNVWEFAGGDASYSWIPTPDEAVEDDDDIVYPIDGLTPY